MKVVFAPSHLSPRSPPTDQKETCWGSHISLTCVSVRFRVWSNPLLLFSFLLFDFFGI